MAVRPFQPGHQCMLQTCYAGSYNQIIDPIHGLPYFFCQVDGDKIDFTSIKKVDLKWFLFITSNDEVVGIAFHQFWMRVR